MSEHIIDEDTYSHISKFGSFRTVGEVIRCRDCRKSDPASYDYCEFHYMHECEPDGFCAWAERRQG